jgi:hypothetical protein
MRMSTWWASSARRGPWLSTLVGALVASSSCGSAPDADRPALPTGVETPPTQTPVVSSPYIWIGHGERELLVGASFVLSGEVISHGAFEGQLPITWRNIDGPTLSIEPLSPSRARIVGERPGNSLVEGSAQLASTRLVAPPILVRVLEAAAPGTVSPIVIEDFRVIEHQYSIRPGQWVYAPQLVLRDTTSPTRSAVIAASFEIPGLDPIPGCAMLRPVTWFSRKLFYEDYLELELNLAQPERRATLNGTAVAHVTVRIPGNVAMTLTVTGPVVYNQLPIDGFAGYGEMLSCG